MDYDPYDLLVVEQHEIDQEYFLISDRGVAHMRPREASDVTYHSQWLEEKKLFMLLRETKFFGKNTLVKVSYHKRVFTLISSETKPLIISGSAPHPGKKFCVGHTVAQKMEEICPACEAKLCKTESRRECIFSQPNLLRHL